LRELVIFGLAFMTPVAPALVYGDALAHSNGAPGSSYIIAFVVILFTAQSYGKLSRNFGGSVYVYVRDGINRYVGFFAGWASYFFYITATAAAFSIGARLAGDIFPAIPYLVWTLLFAVVSAAAVFMGARVTAMANSIIVSLMVAIVAIYILVCVFAAERGTGLGELISTVPLKATDANLGVYVAGGGFACFTFLGFTSITTLSEEAQNSKKNVGRAMILVCAVAGALFFLQTYVSGLIWPEYSELQNIDDALFAVASKAGGPPMVYLYTAAILLAAFSVGIAGQTAAYKTARSMRKNNALPKVAGSAPSLWHTNPVPDMLMVSAAVIAFALSDSLSALSLPGLVKFLGFFCFALVNLSVIIHFYFKRNGKNIFTALLFPAVGFFSSLCLLVNAEPADLARGALILVIGSFLFIPDVYRTIKKRYSRNGECGDRSDHGEAPRKESSK
jgi:amino acid transporter